MNDKSNSSTAAQPELLLPAVITPEQKAKDLGASVVHNKHYTSAENFPTTAAAQQFYDWLLRAERFNARIEGAYTNGCVVRYSAKAAYIGPKQVDKE